MNLGLEGKAALVGGASRGLGRAVAEGLAREGCRVAIAARGREALEATARQIGEAAGVEILPVVCDMSRYEDIRRFVAQTAERFGRLDIVVNNAGGPPLGDFEEHSDEAWQKAIDQNFLSVARVVREALPHLRKQGGGRIINITSVAVKEPIAGLILSNAARLGVVGLAKTLSRELGPDQITVNNVCPGFTLTDRMRELYGGRAEAQGRTLDELLAEEAQRIPIRRLAQPEDLAALVVFLASEPARHITGTTIQVDGGSTAAVM
jgi:3-oxoacyl-[acyl-carrier protein] reductase